MQRTDRLLGWGLSAIVILLWTSGCRKPEPIEHGNYHIDNRTELHLELHATPHHGVLDLVTSEVPPSSKVHFMNVAIGSGGHRYPSNFLASFWIAAGDSVLYEGVRNHDWLHEPPVDRRVQLVLVIE